MESTTEHHPSALRNRIPILKRLMTLMPVEDVSGQALEIASGTGAHLEVYAPAFPNLIFHPSEFVPDVPASLEEQWPKYGKIGRRTGQNELFDIDIHGCKIFANVLPAVALDLAMPWDQWPPSVREASGQFTMIICSNTLHITPWQCSVGLMQGAAKALAPGGRLVVYGPFKRKGEFVGTDGGAGNAKFDEKLRSMNSNWGIRDVDDLSEIAKPLGLALNSQADMPANNLTLEFIKQV